MKTTHKDCSPESVALKIIELFPRDHGETDPFRVLISTVLSQRTRDENTEAASRRLFSKYSTPEQLAERKPAELFDLLRPAGMYRQKASRIIEISRILVKDYAGIVPSSLDDLLRLPGVGRKTANIVLHVSFGMEAMAVDTHVQRISNRIGWVDTKYPDATEAELVKMLPSYLLGPLNGSMVEFGKSVCKPIKPLCVSCEIRECCHYFELLVVHQR